MLSLRLCRSDAFVVPYGNEKEFLAGSDIPFYGKGPDPLDQIDASRSMEEQQLATLCLSTRKKISEYLQKRHSLDPSETNWAAYLTSDELSGLCGFVSACLNYFIKKIPELNEVTTLIYHQTATLFPHDEGGRHMFVVANVNGRSFIIDLTIRQFFNSTLRLREEEAAVFNALLKEGFVELTEQSLAVYRRFFHSQFQYETKGDDYQKKFINGWELTLDELSPMSLESLQTPTTVIDFEDNELKEYLIFTRKKISRTRSLPTAFQIGHHVPTCILKGKIQKNGREKPIRNCSKEAFEQIVLEWKNKSF